MRSEVRSYSIVNKEQENVFDVAIITGMEDVFRKVFVYPYPGEINHTLRLICKISGESRHKLDKNWGK